MIKDLKLVEDRVDYSTPVCIIGAGTVGIFLSQQLRKQGIRVVLLEAGDIVARKPDELDQRCVQHGIRYRGADLGRSFGLGGTSVLWGGQMLPLTPSDMAARPAVDVDAWPLSYTELAPYLSVVKQMLGLPMPDDNEEATLRLRHFPHLSRLDPDFQLRLSEWLPFKIRNFAKAFTTALRTDTELEVWLNAAVVGFKCAPGSATHITLVEARSRNGKTLVVRPEVVVICAGALESTRLMLAFDQASQGLITRSGAPLGRYFTDHLSVTCGRFECRDWRRYDLETAPIFTGGVMRTPRLELSADAQQRLAVTSAFAHFTFITHGDTGFDVVRNLLRQRQGEQQGLGLTPRKLWGIVSDVSAMIFWRSVYRRLWIPRQAGLLLQVDIEQMPNWSSHLSLADERDDLGRKRLMIKWQIKPDDIRVIRAIAKRALQAWNASSLRDVATLRLTLPQEFDDFESLYDVYHPTGTLRMGSAAANSVVDRDLHVWTLENGYISSTAVFPSAGSANPGLTHLALTARLAEHIAKALR
ncbi:MAG: GMC family oxidoreductase [Candidatus Competibacteraceae bacterium]|nr:GMC family oxidoreductase [Candidatus Competibacteraceae bacterium]